MRKETIKKFEKYYNFGNLFNQDTELSNFIRRNWETYKKWSQEKYVYENKILKV